MSAWEPAIAVQYTAVRAPRGRIVHGLRLDVPQRTACGRRARGWHVASTEKLGCRACQLALSVRTEARA